MDLFRLLPPLPGSKGNFSLLPTIGIPTTNINAALTSHLSPLLSPRYGMTVAPGVPFSPVLSPGVPLISPAYAIGAPGTFVLSTTVPASGSASAPGSATATPGAPGATALTPGAPGTTTSYTVITPPITNIRHLTNIDQDPELRRKVVKHFYNQLKDVYFLGKFQNLLKYIVVENGSARLVKSYEELQKNSDNNNDFTLRIKFITENIFSKYDLEVLISKLIAKYSMLYSEDEYNMHWYNAKYKHSRLVKKTMYKKIKYRLQKKVNF
jgi:hypothetical protein